MIEKYIVSEPQRLLIDMDGTLAVFRHVDTLEVLYEKGYFLNLQPISNVLGAIRILAKTEPSIELHIISAVLGDSKYALEEKHQWLDRYLPEVKKERRIFTICGEDKKNYVPGGIRATDFLLDDYTKNLMLWEPPAKGIKLLNGINHTNQTWKGNMLSAAKSPSALAQDICEVMSGREIRDSIPRVQKNRTHQSMEREL